VETSEIISLFFLNKEEKLESKLLNNIDISFIKLDKNSVAYISIKDIPNIVIAIVLIRTHIFLIIEYFLNILINKLIKVNFNNIFLNNHIFSIIFLILID
jgi:hypothetical protein